MNQWIQFGMTGMLIGTGVFTRTSVPTAEALESVQVERHEPNEPEPAQLGSLFSQPDRFQQFEIAKVMKFETGGE